MGAQRGSWEIVGFNCQKQKCGYQNSRMIWFSRVFWWQLIDHAVWGSLRRMYLTCIIEKILSLENWDLSYHTRLNSSLKNHDLSSNIHTLVQWRKERNLEEGHHKNLWKSSSTSSPKVPASVYHGNCILKKRKYPYLSQIVGHGFEFMLNPRDPECHCFPTPILRAEPYPWVSSDKGSLSPNPSHGGHKVSVNPTSGYLP